MNIFAYLPWKTLDVTYSKFTIVGAERGCRVGSAWGWSVPPTPTNGADHPPTNSPTTPGWPERLQWRPRVLISLGRLSLSFEGHPTNRRRKTFSQALTVPHIGRWWGAGPPSRRLCYQHWGPRLREWFSSNAPPTLPTSHPTQPLEDKLKQVWSSSADSRNYQWTSCSKPSNFAQTQLTHQAPPPPLKSNGSKSKIKSDPTKKDVEATEKKQWWAKGGGEEARWGKNKDICLFTMR